LALQTSYPVEGAHDAWFKDRLQRGEKLIGLWLSLGSPVAAEIAAAAGFDWVLIDTEHAPNELPDVVSQLRATTSGSACAVVRPAWNDPVLIKRLLDVGAQTLLIPFVNSVDEALRAVAATRYAPRGIRGFSGCTRANNYGRMTDYAQNSERRICVIVQLETQRALEQLDQIATVAGVDGVFIGAADLSVEMGYPGKVSHPAVWQLVTRAAARLRALGKPAGILLSSAEDIRLALAAGFSLVAVGSDARLLVTAVDRLAADWKPAGGAAT
jgi:4-hydroxy-2-oxoheptanedioate aldolase